MTTQQWAAVVVADIIGFLLIASLFVLWGSHDKRHEDHTERLAVIEERLGAPGVDQPATEPMPRVDLAGGVRAAREANRPRATPYPRGRHRASGLSQDTGS